MASLVAVGVAGSFWGMAEAELAGYVVGAIWLGGLVGAIAAAAWSLAATHHLRWLAHGVELGTGLVTALVAALFMAFIAGEALHQRRDRGTRPIGP